VLFENGAGSPGSVGIFDHAFCGAKESLRGEPSPAMAGSGRHDF